MKIAFFISCIYSKSKGNGGHYHSLATLCNALSKQHKVFVINIGTTKSATLEKEEVKLYNVLSSNVNYKINRNKISEILKLENPNVLHSFDHFAHFWARIFSSKHKLPIIFTKCGGKNPNSYFPFSPNIIFFSLENFNFFKTKNKFKTSNMYTIPNRVLPFECSNSKIDEIKDIFPEISSYSFKFLRICRIGLSYKKSLFQLINLIKRLNSEGLNCCLILVGVVENKYVLEEIKSAMKDKLFLITQNRFINNAKEIIDIGDLVLGTGRSFMEACSKSKIMFSPIENGNYPLLVSENNLDKIIAYNFSERLNIENHDSELNYQLIKKTILNNLEIIEKKKFSKKIFKENFDIQYVVNDYINIYKSVGLHKKRTIDTFLHFLYIVREYKFKF